MVLYPVPIEVTQARVQLVADQTAKAPARTINDDVLDPTGCHRPQGLSSSQNPHQPRCRVGAIPIPMKSSGSKPIDFQEALSSPACGPYWHRNLLAHAPERLHEE